MMDLPVPIGDEIIEHIEMTDTESFGDRKIYTYRTKRGLLRIIFIKENLVNVAFTVNGKFAAFQSWIIDDNFKQNARIKVSKIEDGNNFYLYTDSLMVSISKSTSALSYFRRSKNKSNGRRKVSKTPVFAENEEYGRQFEEVQEYITCDDENVETMDVVTADGLKKVVTSANMKEGRLLYRNRLHLKFDDDEAIYGLGQSEEGIYNHRGHVSYLHQANRKIAIPVMMSSKGYGLFFPSGSAAIFNDNEHGTFFQTEASEMMEYYFLGGTCLDESISLFRYLTGKAEMLPRWAYGYLQSKERYESEEEILAIADEFRKRNIGVDAIILDWLTWEDNMWGQKTLDAGRFPNPDKMMEKLHDENIRLMISIWPNMTSACDNYKEFKSKNMIYPGTEIYDALNAEARDLYWKQVNEGLFCHGIDGFWCDSSEPFTPEWTRKIKPDAALAYSEYIKTAYRSMPYDEINAYGFYHALGIYEGMRRAQRDIPLKRKRVMNLTRNGYPGSQSLGTVLWSGDIEASFEVLRKQVAEGLNICATGLPYWTLDIGAFFVKKGAPWFWDGKYPEALDSPGYKELYVRWYQYGAFLPIFRSHGTDCPREPWQFGDPGDMFYDAIIKANELRYRLLPYIYSVAFKVWRDDYTMMRLLAFDYADDANVINISDQFMFGPSMMICPVLERMYFDEHSKPIRVAKKRTVYFPKGNDWIDIRSRKKYTGGTTWEVEADIYSIPVFVKEGAVIPIAEGLKCADDLDNAEIIALTYGDRNGEPFELYFDIGDGYGYQNGEYSIDRL